MTALDPPRLASALPLRSTDGYAPASDRSALAGPGNEFRRRFREDLVLAASLGIRDVRFSIDWARLLPDLRRVDHDEREHLEQVLTAAEAAGVNMWATLYEGPVPKEFAGEGGWSDDKASGRWWPRFVETAAELFGDRVSGWFPMHDPVRHALRDWSDRPERLQDALRNQLVGWRDAWRILRGGPPMATSLGLWIVRAEDQTVPAAEAARRLDQIVWRLWTRALRDGVIAVPGRMERQVDDLQGACDLVGVGVGGGPQEPSLNDDILRRWQEHLGDVVRRAAEQSPDRPMLVSAFRANRASDSDRATVYERFVESVYAARTDGVPIGSVFVHPLIDAVDVAGPEADGLLTRDREVKESTHSLIAAFGGRV